jgi:CarboxypepD_reg-like domain/TonB-dependent Receptor Plug Domain
MRRIYIFCFFFLFFFKGRAQDIKKISGNFEGFTFAQLIDRLEPSSGFHFYYDPVEIDSIRIHLHADEMTWQEVLDEVLRNTDFHYSTDPAGRVFIIRAFSIQTHLPPSFFQARRQNTPGAPDSLKVFFAGGEDGQAGKSKLAGAIENKWVEIGDKNNHPASGKATLAGYIRDERTGEALVGANLSVDTLHLTTTTDQFGYFSLTLPKGRHLVRISSSGMKDARRQLIVYDDGKIDVNMQEAIASLRTVIVSADKTSNIRSLQMGVNRLSIATIKQVPSVLGEADVLKVLLTLPGVTSVGEASNGFNVRGGSTDQNLILFDDATIYNPSHLFGFFSAFNPEVVKGIELYKSAIPEKYGGRLSSVLDVSMLDGNSKKWSGLVGLGPLTSKAVIQGPIKKDKTSLIAAVRTTYSDWLLNNIPRSSYSNSRANFYDANLRISHMIDSKNTLYVMGYISGDQFRLNNDTTYRYSNRNANIKWKHIFNNKLNMLTTAGFDRYQYSVTDDKDSINAFRLGFNINQTYFHSDFTYSAGNGHTISYGLSSIYYKLNPGFYNPVGSHSLVQNNTVAAEQGLESALYLGDQYVVSPDLSISAGLRYSIFNNLGPHEVYNYVPGQPRQDATIIDSTAYPAGKVIKTYSAPEIRLSARYALSDKASLKFSFNTLQQYIHMLSNTVAISPTDIWKLSDPHIKPQQGNQISLGYYRNFAAGAIEVSVEGYYKQLKNYLDYKSGAELTLNHHIETDVFSTKGKAYGVEFLLKKSTGQLNGWLSYTWSRTFLRQNDPLAGEIVNEGKYYPASFDKPHNVSFIGNYRFSHRYSLSVNVVYSTGRPITLPLAIFNLNGSPGLYYSDRNQYRIPDYFRSDISMNIEGNHKLKQFSHNFWSVGVYNLTGRQNAYSVYFTEENGAIKGYKLSIFGAPIPFVSYTIKF